MRTESEEGVEATSSQGPNGEGLDSGSGEARVWGPASSRVPPAGGTDNHHVASVLGPYKRPARVARKLPVVSLKESSATLRNKGWGLRFEHGPDGGSDPDMDESPPSGKRRKTRGSFIDPGEQGMTDMETWFHYAVDTFFLNE